MKLVMAVVSNNDLENVLDGLAKNGFYATKISTVGQFLVGGHTAVIIGCDDEQVDTVYENIKNNVTKRTVKSAGVTSTITGSLLKQAVDVEEGGAVALTINVEDYKKF